MSPGEQEVLGLLKNGPKTMLEIERDSKLSMSDTILAINKLIKSKHIIRLTPTGDKWSLSPRYVIKEKIGGKDVA